MLSRRVGIVMAKTPAKVAWDSPGVNLNCFCLLTTLKVNAQEVEVLRSEMGEAELPALGGNRKMGQCISNL